MALIGYLVMSLVLVKTHVDDHGDVGLRGLLTIFGLELILVAVFAGHKLFALQATYGFKDQRLLATGAVGLIFMTFVLVCLRVWGRVGSIQIFRAQVVGLAGVVLFLNLVNVDALVSRVNPIRYEQEGQVYLDYSYLIGNSYDNVGSWEKLMREFMESDVPRPSTTYYWGHFSSSRADYYGGSYSPICEERSVYDEELKIMVKRPFTYFEEYFEDLARLGSGESLIEKSRWNLREAEAREFAEGNPELVKDFLGHAKGVCG